MIEVYDKQIRSILELAVPVWHPGLIGEDRQKIERVQKSALCIILGDKYKSYRSALKLLKMKTLFERRNKICTKFAIKAQKHAKFSKWFKPNEKIVTTRSAPLKFKKVFTRTVRYEKSPISYLTKILNNL